MKIDRLLGIVIMLINKKKVTARQLSEYFEVSLRTIQRDMDTLMMAGIPVFADVGMHGGYQLVDNFKLEKGFLSRDEASILLTFLQELEGVTPYSEVDSIYNKFSSLGSVGLDHSKLIVRLHADNRSGAMKEHLALLSRASVEQIKVRMTYYDVDFRVTERVVCPYTLALLGSTWYFYGYCELRSDFRMFKVSRIADCRITEEPFEVRETPDTMPWDTDMAREDEIEEVVVEIDRNLKFRLPDLFSPANCKVMDDRIVAQLHVVVGEWLFTQLMGLVPYITVIAPDYVREAFVARLQESIQRNSCE